MTKSDLIDTLRKETDLTKLQADQVVELFFNEMSNALAVGERVGNQGLLQRPCKKLQRLRWTKPQDRRISPSATQEATLFQMW